MQSRHAIPRGLTRRLKSFMNTNLGLGASAKFNGMQTPDFTSRHYLSSASQLRSA